MPENNIHLLLMKYLYMNLQMKILQQMMKNPTMKHWYYLPSNPSLLHVLVCIFSCIFRLLWILKSICNNSVVVHYAHQTTPSLIEVDSEGIVQPL